MIESTGERKIVERVSYWTSYKCTCDRCGASFEFEQGRAGYKEAFESAQASNFQVIRIKKFWGYPSPRDNSMTTIDLCHKCFEEVLGPYAREE